MGYPSQIIAFDYLKFLTIAESFKKGENAPIIKESILELNDYCHEFKGLKSIVDTFDPALTNSTLGKEIFPTILAAKTKTAVLFFMYLNRRTII